MVTPCAGRWTTVIASPALTEPGAMTRRYAPGAPRWVNRFTQSCSSSQPANVRHGVRGEVLAGIGVDRLVGAAMRARIADAVARDTAPSRFRARIAQRDRFCRWPFVDPGDTRVGVPARRHPADIDGKQRRHRTQG